MKSKYLPSFVKRRGRITKKQELNVSHLESYEVLGANDIHQAAEGFDSIYIEIGFGDGENIISIAKENPDKLFIGSEVYLSGIGSLIGKIIKFNIKNIRIHNGDIRDLLDDIRTPILDGVLIICPDPWPKARHNKRRLINKEFLNLIGIRIKKAGGLYISTDWEDYAENISEAIEGSEAFHYTEEQLFTELPITRFQSRAIKEGREIFRFNLLKN
jgi:tRNA (guanine-N7-)-methyltransferase